MDIALNTADNYWSLLRSLSPNIKLQLISKLSDSLIHKKKGDKNVDASQFYGVWKDADFAMDADAMVDEIKASRSFKDDITMF